MANDSIQWPPAPTGQTEPLPPRLTWWRNLFAVPSGPATAREVIKWWEARRLAYNALVFGLGLVSFVLYLFFVATAANLPPEQDIVEPLLLIAAAVLLPPAVNVCYTAGWVVELLWRRFARDGTRRAGRVLMQAGIGFSLFVILTPSILWGVIWVWHLMIGHKVSAL